MLIGKLAKETSTSHDTIRYYESLGLLDAPPRPNRFNNYKDYPESNVARIGFIRELKSYGFTLKEIVELMRQSKREDFTCASAATVMEAKARAIDDDIRALENRREKLHEIMEKMRKNPGARKPV